MNRLKSFFLTPFSVVFLLLLTSWATAQQKKFTPEEEALKKHIFAFGETYGTFGKHKDKAKVLEYMDKEVLGTLITTDINRKVTSFDSDIAGFDNHLKGILLKDGLNVNYKIINVPRAYVSGEVGVVVYEATYQQQKNEEIWSAGDETVALTLKKDKNGQWKIIHYTTIAFENEKYKGQCFCAVRETENLKYQTLTTAPAGKGYMTYTHDFTFANKDQDKIITIENKIEKKTEIKTAKKTEIKTEVITESYTFYHTFAGELFLLKGKHHQTGEVIDTEELKRENGVGVAPNKEEAMMQIVQKFLMPSICVAMKYISQ
jgi:hypothetical protein